MRRRFLKAAAAKSPALTDIPFQILREGPPALAALLTDKCFPFSSTTQLLPAFASVSAAIMPAPPAPIITTSVCSINNLHAAGDSFAPADILLFVISVTLFFRPFSQAPRFHFYRPSAQRCRRLLPGSFLPFPPAAPAHTACRHPLDNSGR